MTLGFPSSRRETWSG
uniref:Uncharacterized protein n=1 Tax=Anguilla anguilla TaxID=7936 RepID=A0A0E9RME0_ANGAN